MSTRKHIAIAALVSAASLFGCAARGPAQDYDALVQKMMQGSFRDQGIAKMDRLQQDDSNAACSEALGKPLSEDKAKQIEAANLKTVKMPSDGKFIGNWKAGETLAQNGRGMTWSDPSAAPSANGGNCYNCHQISKKEISFGTLGPSLYNYGKLRGVTDPSSAAAKPIVEYTWGKLYNAKAYNACSGMPRFGHGGMLNEAQLKDLMALLLDPKSEVNQ
ncbi:MAG: sulfur oxidation c-type cytochrome SoxX [Gammaproteobacteria bacterium]|nr:sulfur oxidation c-type cytochrome SoxX [Gammaproteobacteria bacterium]MBU1440788.1 sulfur oxidation c-type cytochrome SoxX [Gammaproteobacteria bacterium]MBU2287775.1 sulfur oxidation c-type cytochrome SoxX [Gammaproteobacteria bacterium]MBU2407380.1 sulfur oxidation c-type cytochrome SoxX [Gammaproteobacteria bacterium]